MPDAPTLFELLAKVQDRDTPPPERRAAARTLISELWADDDHADVECARVAGRAVLATMDARPPTMLQRLDRLRPVHPPCPDCGGILVELSSGETFCAACWQADIPQEALRRVSQLTTKPPTRDYEMKPPGAPDSGPRSANSEPSQAMQRRFVADYETRPQTFPIQYPRGLAPWSTGDPRSVPWSMVQEFDHRARRNHSQTLQRLAARGGLCAAPVRTGSGRINAALGPAMVAVYRATRRIADR